MNADLITVTADAALADLPEGARIVAGNVSGTPLTLLRALGRRPGSAGAVDLHLGLTLGDPRLRRAVTDGAVRIRSWHVHGEIRQMLKDGLADYTPLRLIDLPQVVLSGADAALIRVGPPDAEGYCSVGPSASYVRSAVALARLVIAEVADDVPVTSGDSRVHVSEIDRFVVSDVAMPVQEPSEPGPVALAVARNVVGIIQDGATIQMGIGAIGDAVASEVTRVGVTRSLRPHGMISDPMRPLVDAIAAEGGRPVQGVELLGTRALMDWADRNPGITMVDSQRAHHPAVIASIPAFVSVNSAIAVDLRGQVVAETVQGGVIAGVGGSADFAEGAHLSDGGMRVIAIASTTRRGESTIVAGHAAGDLVSAAHHSIDAVVTEHGVAWLRGRTQAERRRGLIAVAAPEHRDALERAGSDAGR